MRYRDRKVRNTLPRTRGDTTVTSHSTAFPGLMRSDPFMEDEISGSDLQETTNMMTVMRQPSPIPSDGTRGSA